MILFRFYFRSVFNTRNTPGCGLDKSAYCIIKPTRVQTT